MDSDRRFAAMKLAIKMLKKCDASVFEYLGSSEMAILVLYDIILFDPEQIQGMINDMKFSGFEEWDEYQSDFFDVWGDEFGIDYA